MGYSGQAGLPWPEKHTALRPCGGHAAAMRHGSDGSEVMEVMEEAGLPDLPVESAPKNVLGP